MIKSKEKLKAVATAIAAIEKQFGKGAVMPLDGSQVTEIEVIPTGSLTLDLALGVGGPLAARSCRRRNLRTGVVAENKTTAHAARHRPGAAARWHLRLPSTPSTPSRSEATRAASESRWRSC